MNALTQSQYALFCCCESGEKEKNTENALNYKTEKDKNTKRKMKMKKRKKSIYI